MRSSCAVLGAPFSQPSRDRLWTVLKFRHVRGHCRAIISLINQLYILLRLLVDSGLLGMGEEEEFRSDNQEQEDIDGTGEVEY